MPANPHTSRPPLPRETPKKEAVTFLERMVELTLEGGSVEVPKEWKVDIITFINSLPGNAGLYKNDPEGNPVIGYRGRSLVWV